MSKPAHPDRKQLLVDELARRTREERELFAARVGLSLGGLQQIAYGNRPCRFQYAIRIDRETKGRVPFTYLIPTADWEYVAKVASARVRALKKAKEGT